VDTCRHNVDTGGLSAKMWTDADNKYRQHRHQHHAKSNQWEEVSYGMVHLRSGEPAQYFEMIKLALRPMKDPARIDFVDTADNCGQKMWADADCPQ